LDEGSVQDSHQSTVSRLARSPNLCRYGCRVTATPGEPAPQRERRWVAANGKQITAAVLVVLAVWFALVNRSSTKITFWLVDVAAPLWLVLAGTFVGGLAAGWLIRRRRRG
jgi:uncharacterized integral membrane protein